MAIYAHAEIDPFNFTEKNVGYKETKFKYIAKVKIGIIWAYFGSFKYSFGKQSRILPKVKGRINLSTREHKGMGELLKSLKLSTVICTF